MVNALVQDLMEERYLYRQNAAMRHGVPIPPQRTIMSLVAEEQPPAPAPPSPQPEPAPQAPPPQPPPQPVVQHHWAPQPPPPAQSSSLLLPLAIALLTAPLLGVAGLAAGYMLTRDKGHVPDAPVVERPATPNSEPLLEYLDREGYSRPYPDAIRPLTTLP